MSFGDGVVARAEVALTLGEVSILRFDHGKYNPEKRNARNCYYRSAVRQLFQEDVA